MRSLLLVHLWLLLSLFTGGAIRAQQIFTYTGATKTYTVPSGVSYLLVKLWGGGGGGGSVTNAVGFGGGAGGYTQCYLSATPGQQLDIIVGGAGEASKLGSDSNGGFGGGGTGMSSDTNFNLGGGGGRSAVQITGKNEDLVTAGAGGGGGTICAGEGPAAVGGGGGGLVGLSVLRATGGNQTAGGLGTIGSYSIGGDGARYQGGVTKDVNVAGGGKGGGGGSGYFGGASGCDNGTCPGGGAGGSGYIGGCIATATAFTAAGSSGSNHSQALTFNMLDASYQQGIALGGLPGTSTSTSSNGNGGNGLVVIEFVCGAGNYLSGNICQACPAGRYSNKQNQTSCLECASGNYSITGHGTPTGQKGGGTGCAKADIGNCSSNATTGDPFTTCVSSGAGNQLKCPIGFYSNSSGHDSCTACQAGYYSTAGPGTNLNEFFQCASGTYSSKGACTSAWCPAGTGTPTGPRGGGTGCTFTSLGHCSSNGTDCTSSSSFEQLACPFGTYQNVTGQVACRDCLSGTYSSTGCFEKSCAVGTGNATGPSGGGTGCTIFPPLAYFSFVGSSESWKVPSGVASLLITAKGAQGGDYLSNIGGLGGLITATNIAAVQGQTLHIFVGGKGSFFNGGGHSAPYFSSNGGGGTDIRTNATDLNSRLAVAGGGGGAGNSYNGGAGGGNSGAAGMGTDGGGGGSQTSGGSGKSKSTYTSTSGAKGKGGNGAGDGGGGGGGFFGGGGGILESGGGGGSSSSPIAAAIILENEQGIVRGDGSLSIAIASCLDTHELAADYLSCICITATCAPSPSPTASPSGPTFKPSFSPRPSPVPTTRPSAFPSRSPTPRPSPQPSARPSPAPTYKPGEPTPPPSPAPQRPTYVPTPLVLVPVALKVAQEFKGMSASLYPSNDTPQKQSEYNEAIISALVDSMNHVNRNFLIFNTDIIQFEAPTASTRRALQASTSTDSFTVNYIIATQASTFTALSKDVTNATQENHYFFAQLHNYAEIYNALGLKSVNYTSVLMSPYAFPIPLSSPGYGLPPLGDLALFVAVIVITFILASYVHRGRADMIVHNDNDLSARRKVVALTFFDISLSLLLVIVGMVAQLVQANNYLSYAPSSYIYAYLIITLRTLVALSTLYLVRATLFQAWLSPFLEAKRLHASFMFAVIILVSLFDPSLLRLLPWISTPFSDRAGGMPNYTFFKVVNAITLTNSIGMTCIILVADFSNSTSGGNKSEATVSLALSAANFAVSLLTVLLRIMAEKIYEFSITVTRGRGNNDEEVEDTEEGDAKAAAAEKQEEEEEEDDVDGAAGGERFSFRMRKLQEQESALSERTKQFDMERDELLRRERELRTQAALDLVVATKEKEKEKEKNKAYDTDVKHADETVLVMRNQLLKKGEMPLMYIPLDELQAELNDWIAKINRNEPYDEKRLDFLVACLEINPDAIAEQQRIRSEWDAANTAFLDTCFVELFAFIPPDIASLTLEQLVAKGYTKELAKRFAVQCKCLRLLRLPSHEIGRMHESDLTARFSVEGVNLDLRELCAIYAKIRQVDFLNDQRGTKAAYRNRLYEKIVKLRKEDLAGTLAAAKKIHPAYKSNTPLYANRQSLTEMDLVSSSDPFGRQNDFLSLSASASASGGYSRSAGGGGAGGGSVNRKQRVSELESAFARPSLSIARATRLSATTTSTTTRLSTTSTTTSDFIPNPLPAHLMEQDVIQLQVLVPHTQIPMPLQMQMQAPGTNTRVVQERSSAASDCAFREP